MSPPIDPRALAEMLFLAGQLGIVTFMVAMGAYQLRLMLAYRSRRGADPEPPDRFAPEALPVVTVQLPVYNEGRLVERCLRTAAELDYPPQRLQVQLLDDSDDGVTTRHALAAIDAMRAAHPGVEIQYLRRADREGYKSGALRFGVERGRGELFAVFDADFVIPKDFLRRTVDHFTDPGVAAVQGRWDYLNRDASFFTRLQAAKLDAHQMFEQAGRYRTGLWAIFHGTAGLWRASALEAAGGWNCRTEVEDVEVSIRSFLGGGRVVYLDHLRVPSELPPTMRAYLAQQMRWKRGWTRVVRIFTVPILRSRAPLRQRVDLLQRIHQTWGPALSLPMTLGVLPTFVFASRHGAGAWAALLYATTLVLSLAARFLEEKTLREDPAGAGAPLLPPWLRWVPLGYLLGLGSVWALTQATLEGFGGAQIWEVTPKSGTTPGSAGHAAASRSGRVPPHAVGTLAIGALSGALLVGSLASGHVLAALFYAMLGAGSAWVGGALVLEVRRARPPAGLRPAGRRAAG